MQNYLAPFAQGQPVMHDAPQQAPWYRQRPLEHPQCKRSL